MGQDDEVDEKKMRRVRKHIFMKDNIMRYEKLFQIEII
jgi:hypothetical protein